MASEAVIFQQIVDINWDQAIYTASPNNTINVSQFAAKGSGTNIGIALTPKGTGYISAQVPDGTAAGGNARGSNAIDLQFTRTSAAAVASGSRSVVIGGQSNDATADDSVSVGGRGNASRGTRSVNVGGFFNAALSQESTTVGGVGNYAQAVEAATIGGARADAHRRSMLAHASGMFAAVGDAQSFTHEMRCKTTTNSPVELFIDGSATRMILRTNTVIAALVEITGLKSDGSASASYHRQVEIKRIGSTTTLVKNEVLGVDNASGTSIAITADDANEALAITATGIAAETWRWMATIRGSEMGMGT